MSTIQTPRLQIRLLTKRDASDLYEAVVETIEQLLPWMSWAELYKTGGVEVAEKFIENVSVEAREAQKATEWHFGLWKQEKLVGVVALMRFDRTTQSIEIGYWCRASEQRKGFITEAVNALTRFALESLSARRVTLICREENLKSAAVAERLQFKLNQIGPYDGDILPNVRYRFYCCSCCSELPDLEVRFA